MKNTRTIVALIALAALSVTAVKAQTVIGAGKGGVGFPITITQPGSYKLAANLAVPAGAHGIVVTVPGVTIDLNGFSITGPAACTGPWSTITCTNATHIGVTGSGGVTLRNGRVSGFLRGVDLGDNSMVEGMVAESNAEHGLRLGERAVVRGVTTRYDGIGIGAMSGLVQGAMVSQSAYGMLLYGGMAQSSVVREVHYGVQGFASPHPGVRETVINAAYTYMQNAISMGNNLCNGAPC